MSVEFEPVKLAPRRRRLDPVVIGALMVMIGVAVAVAKPWNASVEPGTGGLGGAVRASSPTAGATDPLIEPRATAAPDVPGILTGTTASTAWELVRAAIRPHDGWGIRAIVGEPYADSAPVSDRRFVELWNAMPNDPSTSPRADIEPSDRPVVAIGITFPATHTPLDARIWLIHADRLEWIDTQALDSSPGGGAFLYRLANRDGSLQGWPAGRYRIDVLVDGGIRRLGFTLPNRFGVVPDRSEAAAELGDLIDPANSTLPDLPIGLFATTDGISISLAAEEGPALDELGAWLDVDPGTGRAPRSFVAATHLSAVTGVGVMLPPGSIVRESTVSRLAPEPLSGDPVPVEEVAIHAIPSAHVLYRPPGGGAWTPGVYRFTVTWADAAGLHEGSWHLELRPGPIRESPPLLLATRAFARYAGERGIVVGTAEPLEGGPRSVAIRLLKPRPQASTVAPAGDAVTCDGVRVDGFAGIAGVAYPVDAAPPTVTARALYDSSRSVAQPLLTAARNSPGLELVAPIGEAAPASYVYRLRVGDDGTTPGATVCLWTSPAG